MIKIFINLLAIVVLVSSNFANANTKTKSSRSKRPSQEVIERRKLKNHTSGQEMSVKRRKSTQKRQNMRNQKTSKENTQAREMRKKHPNIPRSLERQRQKHSEAN